MRGCHPRKRPRPCCRVACDALAVACLRSETFAIALVVALTVAKAATCHLLLAACHLPLAGRGRIFNYDKCSFIKMNGIAVACLYSNLMSKISKNNSAYMIILNNYYYLP